MKDGFFNLRAKTPQPLISHHLSHSHVSASNVDPGDLPAHKASMCCIRPNLISALDLPSVLWIMLMTMNIHLSPLTFFVLNLGEANPFLLLFLSLLSILFICNSQLQQKASYCILLKTYILIFKEVGTSSEAIFIHSFSIWFHRWTSQAHWKVHFSHYLPNTQSLKAGNAMRKQEILARKTKTK